MAKGQAAPYKAARPVNTPPSPINQSAHNLQQTTAKSARNSYQKTASVLPPEDGRLTPETCRGLPHNKVIVIVKVY
jgi:hypothetical protein